MNTKKYHWILYLIALTILVTIAAQVYWNYKNYALNRQRVTNEIQLSLDNALEEYYAGLAKTDFLTIIETEGVFGEDSILNSESDTSNHFNFFGKSDVKVLMKTSDQGKEKADSIFISVQNDLNSKSEEHYDSIIGFTQFSKSGEGYTFKRPNSIKKVQVLKGKDAYDSLSIRESLKPILIAIHRDTLEYAKIDSLIDNQLNQKQIAISYALQHTKADSLIHGLKTNEAHKNFLFVNSKSTYLKPEEEIKLLFSNPFSEAIKRSSIGILISFILSVAIISCLFYLLKIIKYQKQLAEVKNDLISNITHEFKTPIATIGVALESIKDFNVLNDEEKTKTYLDMSGNQLTKLNLMVEKLLETATLDSDDLVLNKEDANIHDMLHSIVSKHRMQTAKSITYSAPEETIHADVDVFHFENALNNILDNAIKYGGNTIVIDLSTSNKMISISISDDGNSLTESHKHNIFEKFYRIPKGNTHDIKGFGIGLYYAKKIIEKHGGTIHLDLHAKTTFKITIPHE